MDRVRKFFEIEKAKAGWRFWLFWVVMTNIGFFVGLGLGNVLGRFVSGKLLQATVTAIIIGLFTGAAQGIVLRGHQISLPGWFLATTVGWPIGIFIAGLIIFNLDTTVLTTDFFRWILPSALIAGAIVGIPQVLVLRQRWPNKSWQWIVISLIGWGIQFPGMFPGIFLASWLRSQEQKTE